MIDIFVDFTPNTSQYAKINTLDTDMLYRTLNRHRRQANFNRDLKENNK